MPKLVASTPNAEIIGQAMLGIVNNLRHDELLPLLTQYGVEKIDPERWYPQQIFLDIYRDMQDGKINSSENMVAIAVKIVETAVFPPGINSVETMIQAISMIYKSNIRNVPETEGYWGEIVGPGHAVVKDNSPYLPDSTYGFIWALVKRFRPEGSQFVVRILNPNAGVTDDEPVVFDVTWEPKAA
jgi:hypothetical protein